MPKTEDITEGKAYEELLRMNHVIATRCERLSSVRHRYVGLLQDTELLKRYHKGFHSANSLEKMAAYLKDNPDILLTRLDAVTTALEKDDKQLAKKLKRRMESGKIQMPNSQMFENINRIVRIVSQDKDRFTIAQELRAEYPHLAGAVSSMENSKQLAELLTELKQVILLLSGEEKDYLNKYRQDVDSWPKYERHGKTDIRFYMQRVGLYFGGRGEQIDNITWKGLLTYFNDKRCNALLAKNEYRHIKQLWQFEKQLRMIQHLRIKITRGIDEAKWQDFEDFYHNVKRYINIIRHTFGNEEFAKVLEKDVKEIKEQPVRWKNEFLRLEKELLSPEFQEKFVIKKAAEDLLEIFSIRLKEIQKDGENALKAFKERVTRERDSLIQGLNSFVKGVVSRAMAMKRKLMTEYQQKRQMLIDTEEPAFDAGVKYNIGTTNFFALVPVEKDLKIVNRRIKRRNWMKDRGNKITPTLSSLSDNPSSFAKNPRVYSSSVLELALIASSQQHEFDDAFERTKAHAEPDMEVVETFRMIVRQGNEVYQRLGELNKYIAKELEEHFGLSIDELMRIQELAKYEEAGIDIESARIKGQKAVPEKGKAVKEEETKRVAA